LGDGPKSDAYDVIVVGAGFGGLSAGASLAKLGKSVLVVERHDGAGGYARAFRRGSYLFDPAIHVTAQGQPGGFLDIYLRLLGVRELVDLITIDELYAADFPDARIHVPTGVEAFIETHARRWPAEEEAIARFVRTAGQLVVESQTVPARLGLQEIAEAEARFPTLFRYRLLSLGDVLDDFFHDAQLKSTLAAAWPYLGVPPAKLSFPLYASMLFSMIESANYSKGSFQRLADAFAAALERSGGELLLSTHVSRIDVADGRVTGITLEDGGRVRTDAVISNVDATQTVEELIGVEHFPDKFIRRFRRFKPSLSAFVVYTATDLDLRDYGLASEVFMYPDWDHDRDYAKAIAAKSATGTWVSIPTMHDPSLAPEGEHLLVASGLVPYDIGEPWDGARGRFSDLMLDRVERLIPGFKESITFSESATPETMKRYTLSKDGAIYGWEQSPQQSTGRRLPPRLPIDGVLLAGHWTEPGAGSFRAMYSGFLAATILLGFDGSAQMMGALGGGAGPPA
jgi:phytoene dehydrogenase-like protein